MKLDEKRILQTAENVKNGTESRETLIELLGGDMLDAIFDGIAKRALVTSVIESGRIHDLLITEGSGIDVLEGLLNNRIIGDLSDFYMIKPSYILGLSPEEQRKMAQCISAGREDLCMTLQKLWSRGIMTEACSTKLIHDEPMILFSIGFDDEKNQELVQQLYEQDDIECEAYCIEANRFEVRLSGENLYRYLGEDRIPVSKNRKTNIFEIVAQEGLEWFQDMYDEHVRCDVDTTDDKACMDSLKNFLKKCKDKMKPWELSPSEQARVSEELHKIHSGNSLENDVLNTSLGEKEVSED